MSDKGVDVYHFLSTDMKHKPYEADLKGKMLSLWKGQLQSSKDKKFKPFDTVTISVSVYLELLHHAVNDLEKELHK